MRRTDLSRSPGVDRAAAAFALWFSLAGNALAEGYQSGKAAFMAQDWSAARAIWLREAETGSPEALLGLGNLKDLGLGGPVDPEGAYDLYRKAALAGLADAALNVAVMEDGGIGTPQDRASAAVWYARAALGGHARAAYVLGGLYAKGEGVPRNPDLARYWLDVAKELPAARQALSDLAPANERSLTTPLPLAADIVGRDGRPQARLVWTSSPGPKGSRFRIELIRVQDDGGLPQEVAAAETGASALTVALPGDSGRYYWRVVLLGQNGKASSAWHEIAEDGTTAGPARAVTFVTNPRDERARAFAERSGAEFALGGVLVRYSHTDDSRNASSVAYRHAADRDNAADVARGLPGLADAIPIQYPGLDAAPGEIVVTVVFDG